jgi:hypothetical protein
MSDDQAAATEGQEPPADGFGEATPVDEFSPDTPETHAPADFPPPPLEMQPPPAGEPWESLPAGMPLDAGGPAVPKKRTGLIVAVVIGVLVLMCGCGVAIVLALFDLGASDTSGTATTTTQASEAETTRQQRWMLARASFPTTGFVTYAADERQAALAGQAVEMLLPDFAVDDLRIHPGSYDAAENWYEFDTYVTRLRLASDPTVTLLFAFDVATVEADAAKLSKEDIKLETGDQLKQLPGGSWLIYAGDTREPLIGGIKDPTYVALLKTAQQDWAGGDVSILSPMSDGGVDVHVYTLQSYADSEAHDYVECVYRKKDGAWTLDSYDIRRSTDSEEPLVVPSET